MKVLDLFSGIGGFSYGLESTGGFETVAFAECEPYPIAVLKKHWPTVRVYEDVRQITATRLFRDRIQYPDVITGGFPCQDISQAGSQDGISGAQSGLWSELHRIISEVRPSYAIVENVAALLSGDRGGWFGTILRDLASIGYDARWKCISASSVGAPHIRNRIFIVAYPNRKGLEGSEEAGDTSSKRPESHEQLTGCHKINPTWKVVGGVCGMDDGLSYWLHTPEPPRVTEKNEKATPRLKALGNSIVPQIAYLIGQEILNYEESLCQQQ